MAPEPMSATSQVRAFAPATVSNVACGFDVLGFALGSPGDEVVARRREGGGVVIEAIDGDRGTLPREAERNTAGVAVQALLAELGHRGGVGLAIRKGVAPAGGLGSSGASAVAAVVAADALLAAGLPRTVLLRCAMAGEQAGCGSAHPDNVAPALYGGWVLVRGQEPPDVVPLPVPEGLACAVVRPHLAIETARARALLGATVPLAAAVRQWGNLGGLVAGLHRGDLELVRRCLEDAIAEPRRAHLLPGFFEVKAAALAAGALGASFSGSGPSMFALCRSLAEAEGAAAAMAEALARASGLESDRFASGIAPVGARLLPCA